MEAPGEESPVASGKLIIPRRIRREICRENAKVHRRAFAIARIKTQRGERKRRQETRRNSRIKYSCEPGGGDSWEFSATVRKEEWSPLINTDTNLPKVVVRDDVRERKGEGEGSETQEEGTSNKFRSGENGFPYQLVVPCQVILYERERERGAR